MAENGTKQRKLRKTDPEYPILLAGLTAARAPRPPREECAVFGCRSSNLDPGLTFHPFPDEQERWNSWLKLINRQDLSEKLRSGRCSARVCSLHFAPGELAPSLQLPAAGRQFIHADLSDALRSGRCSARVCSLHFAPGELAPSLQLPAAGRQFIHAGPAELGILKAECDEIKFEPEYPPYAFDPLRPNVDQLRPNVDQLRPNVHQLRTNVDFSGSNIQLLRPNVDQLRPNVDFSGSNVQLPGPNVDQLRPNVDTPRPNVLPRLNVIQVSNVNHPSPNLRVAIDTIDLTSIKSEPEPNYFDFQHHVGTQTDSTEALHRTATFSAVEQINIPPTKRSVGSVKQNSVETQTCEDLTEFFTRGIKRRLGAELEEAEKKLKLAENPHVEKTQFLKGCDKYLDEKIANFIQSHAYLYEKFEGNKYPESFKSFVLNLYLRNPTSYKFVERFFNLPSKRTIQQFKMPVKTGINENLMQFFKVKVEQMSLQAKMCVVCWEVIPLSRNFYYDVTNDYLCGMEEIDQVCGPEAAEYAALITVRGLYTRWKQPVSFAFFSKINRFVLVKTWLVKTITGLLDIGLSVKALVTKSDDEFVGITVDESAPFFEVHGQKIYHIFDVPDLFKKVRDQLMEYDFHIGDAVAKWEHVVSVYESDKQQEMRLMTNITENHVRPDAESKNDIKLATQVFSNSVAAAMHFYVVARLHHKQTKDTVQFMTKMTNLFDILYSRTLANAYRGSSSQHRSLKEVIEYLKSIEVKDNDGNIQENKFASGLIITIKSVMALMVNLKRCNVRYLLTKNLSKDFMQVFFDEAKRMANSERLTPIKFTRAFRKLFLVNLLNNTKKGATEKDMNVTLVDISEYVKANIDKKNEPDETKSLAVGVDDYKVKWPSNEYIAGYLLWKCLEQHTCPQSTERLCEYCKFDKPCNPELLIQTFEFYNSKNVRSTFMIKPPKQFVDFVGVMENKFDDYFKRWDRNNINFGRNIFNELSGSFCLCPCACFPVSFMKMLYIRLKIYDTVKKCSKINKH